MHRLIEAFSKFKEKTNSDVKLVLVGRSGWMTDEVINALNYSNYQNDIVFTGFVEKDELPKLIAGALGLTYVSLFEGFGIPILEAFHCETPVITSNTSSMPEVGGEAVLYADPLSIESIAKQMIMLYKNPNLRNELIEKGRQQRSNFSWEKAAEVMYAQIEKIAQENDIV